MFYCTAPCIKKIDLDIMVPQLSTKDTLKQQKHNDTQHNNNKHNDTHHNATQHNDK
jgi:hypothetical protein